MKRGSVEDAVDSSSDRMIDTWKCPFLWRRLTFEIYEAFSVLKIGSEQRLRDGYL